MPYSHRTAPYCRSQCCPTLLLQVEAAQAQGGMEPAAMADGPGGAPTTSRSKLPQINAGDAGGRGNTAGPNQAGANNNSGITATSGWGEPDAQLLRDLGMNAASPPAPLSQASSAIIPAVELLPARRVSSSNSLRSSERGQPAAASGPVATVGGGAVGAYEADPPSLTTLQPQLSVQSQHTERRPSSEAPSVASQLTGVSGVSTLRTHGSGPAQLAASPGASSPAFRVQPDAAQVLPAPEAAAPLAAAAAAAALGAPPKVGRARACVCACACVCPRVCAFLPGCV